MPPKAKFSKEQITEAGLQIVREKGADGLTARALGEKARQLLLSRLYGI